ncbi:MAG: alpha-E domain-containing protein [Anaerolineae bacterium]|nr:alpha-E domain-containing protein [Anaerolineae bacterium]
MLSRVADSLYWLSRYLERAEHATRQIDVQLHLMLDQTPDAARARWTRVLKSLNARPDDVEPFDLIQRMTFDPTEASSIINCIAAARENARQLREHISSEMWEQLNRLFLQLREAKMEDTWRTEPHTLFVSIKEGIHLFQGITDSTMNYNEGYQFIQVGRYIERAGAVARLLDVHFGGLAHPHGGYSHDSLEWIGLLKSCTAFEAYCKVYTADVHPDAIAEFLILNPEFPHSLAFAVDRIRASLLTIADQTESRKGRSVNRLAGRLAAMVDYGQVDEIFDAGIHHYLDDVARNCVYVHDAVFRAYIYYDVVQEFAD